MTTPIYERTKFGAGTNAKYIYAIGSAIAFALVYTVAHEPPPRDWSAIFWSSLIAIVVMAAAGTSGRFFERRHKRSNQSKRDRRAQLILNQACQGRVGDYSVYLRAFTTTGQMPAEDTSPFIRDGFDPRPPESTVVDLEAVFAQVLELSAPLVALGKPGEQVGAGRLKTDDDHWKSDLTLLADNALLLLVLPSTGESFQWEIEWIRASGHLKKSLFVMPPKKSWFVTLPGRSRPFEWSETWRTMGERLGKSGITLPQYDKRGIGEDGAVSAKASLQGWLNPFWVSKLVGTLLNDVAKQLRTANKSQNKRQLIEILS